VVDIAPAEGFNVIASFLGIILAYASVYVSNHPPRQSDFGRHGNVNYDIKERPNRRATAAKKIFDENKTCRSDGPVAMR
jgi:hypothetical protein